MAPTSGLVVPYALLILVLATACEGNSRQTRAEASHTRTSVPGGLSETPYRAVLSGTAKDCFARKPYPVRDVNVSAFKVANARPIVAQLELMDRFTGFANLESTATGRFDAMEMQLRSLIVGTPALARGTSSADGAFSFDVATRDSVLVTGYHDLEDDPYAYAYKIVSGQSGTSFVLDMSRGQCGY